MEFSAIVSRYHIGNVGQNKYKNRTSFTILHAQSNDKQGRRMSEKLLDDTAAGSGSSAVTPEHVNINVVGSTHRKGSDDHEYEEPFDISLSKFDKENGVKTILSLVFMMVFMIGLPIALYFGLRNVHGTLYALLISGIPPLLHVIITFIRHRRLDFLGILVVLAFILSAVISLVTGMCLMISLSYY